MSNFITRSYNEIYVNETLTCVTKKSNNQRLIDESKYYASLTDNLKPLFPTYYGESRDKENIYLFLEYFPYKNLFNYIENRFIDKEKIITRLNQYLDILNNTNSFKEQDEVQKSCYDMFIKKTENEFIKLIEQNVYFNDLYNKDIIINNNKYQNFSKIWSRIKLKLENIIKKQSECRKFHGDLCLSNILYFNGCMKLIDPRGSFGCLPVTYGPSLYDGAKLLHSILGRYEDIIYDNYRLYRDLDIIDFEFTANNSIFDINKWKDLFSRWEYEEIKLIMGTIFIGMCAGHNDSFDRQVIMYSTGIKTLNECL